MQATSGHNRLTFHSMMMFVAVVLSVLAVSRPASAQGTFGSFADPITSAELDIYAKRLGLSDEQYRALLSAHDDYKKEFRALREGPIEAFMDEQGGMQAAMRMPQRETVESFVNSAEKINKQIASLDNRLFDSIAPILSDQQQAMLPRVRMHRERKRFVRNSMMMTMATGGGEFVDLSEIISAMELTSEQLSPVDPVLGQYERRLTGNLRQLHEATTRMYLNMIDAYEEAGLADLDFSDPKVMGERMEEIQAVTERVFGGIQQKGLELADFNDRSYRNLADLIGGEKGRELRDRYIAKSYPQATFALDTNGPQFAVALELDGLTNEQRTAIEAAAAGYRNKMDQLLRTTLDMLRERRETRSLTNPMGSFREQREQINKLNAKAERIIAQADDTLFSILHDEQEKRYAALAQKQLQKRMEDGFGGFSTVIAKRLSALAKKENARTSNENKNDGASRNVSSENVIHSVGLDQFLPSGISRVQITRYAEELGFDEGERAVLRELHSAYVERLRRVRDHEMKAVREANRAFMSQWGEARETSRQSDVSDLEELKNLRQKTFQAIVQAEQALFDDVDLVLSTDAQRTTLKRLRAARKRQRLQLVATGSTVGIGPFDENKNAASVDFRSLIESQQYSDEQISQIEPVVRDYELKLIDVLEQLYEKALEADTIQKKWMIKRFATRNEQQPNVSFDFEEYRKTVGRAQKAVENLRAQIASLNDDTLQTIRERLGEKATANLHQSYLKRMFPDAYENKFDISGKLEKALELNDLADAQRRELENIAVKYHRAFEQQVERLVELQRQSPGDMMSMERENWQKIISHRQEVQKVEFERRELAARATAELKIILSDDQIARIGGLPEISE